LIKDGSRNMLVKPASIEELQSLVRETAVLLPRGGGTKPALSTPPQGVESLEMTSLAGMLDYQPDEFTFTALAGTRIDEINRCLAEHGQYLPFDPPLVERGATLGGTVASGVSGPGRYHYGGVRDFLLGVRYVDGNGQLVRGGGKVVKNAAGFDLPKLMVGSRGCLGVLVELSFKVFPRPEAFASLRLENDNLDGALQAMQRVAESRLDVDSLDIEVTRAGFVLWVRLGGLSEALPPRLERLKSILTGGQLVQGSEEEGVWSSAREMSWVPPGWLLVRVPLSPGKISALEAGLAGKPVLRRYMAGGQVAWLATPETLQNIEALLVSQGLLGQVLFGPPGGSLLGEYTARSFYQRVKSALDPERHFMEV
jgi:glycolate dehydrogenase FAD-binding subunit